MQRKRPSRLILSLLLGVIVVGFAGYRLTSSSAATTKKGTTHRATKKHTSKRRHASHLGRHSKRHRRHSRHSDGLRKYASGILPALDQSRRVFDRAAIDEARSASASSCADYGAQINILEGEADGVPHPYQWYQPVGWMHRTMMGIFHDMLGALQLCQTSSSSGDSGSMGTAVSDMVTVAANMRHLDDEARAASHKR